MSDRSQSGLFGQCSQDWAPDHHEDLHRSVHGSRRTPSSLNDINVVGEIRIDDNQLTMRTPSLIDTFNKHLWQANVLIR